MVTPPPSRQRDKAEGEPRPIAAFDFDGTLTVKDSYGAFLKWTGGPVGWLARLPLLAPAAAAYLLHKDRGRLKETVTRFFFKDHRLEAVRARAEQFAQLHFDRLIRPDALKRWREHQANGDLVVIVTASPEIVVEPFARRLGADVLLGTRLVVDGRGRITGVFESPNCRGDEKVRRLRAHFGERMELAAAYGDTSGDKEMLAIAREPGFRVFTGRPARARAGDHNRD